MKKNTLILFAAVLAPAFGHAANVSLSFATDTFTPNFNQSVNGGAVGSGNLIWDSVSGILDNAGAAGGGIKTGALLDQSAVYKTSSFDLTTGVNTISEYVKYTSTVTGDKPLQLGFVNGATSQFNSNAGVTFLTARILGANNVEFQYRNAAGTTAQLDSINFTTAATNGDWLKLTLSLQLTNAAAGTFTYSYSVLDYGQNGTSATPSTLASISTHTVTDAGYAGTATAAYFAGFRTTNVVAPGFDNFSVSTAAVPEPGTAALLGLGGLFLARRRRA